MLLVDHVASLHAGGERLRAGCQTPRKANGLPSGIPGQDRQIQHQILRPMPPLHLLPRPQRSVMQALPRRHLHRQLRGSVQPVWMDPLQTQGRDRRLQALPEGLHKRKIKWAEVRKVPSGQPPPAEAMLQVPGWEEVLHRQLDLAHRRLPQVLCR
jgi:hypothetical protein